jgi:carbon-monoxide dehydrogenase medium subunit
VYPAEFSYLRARSVAHALEVLADGAADEDVKVLAGGQSLLPMMKLRLATPGVLLDIGGLDELRTIHPGEGRIGALATYRSLQRDPGVAARYPAMTDALRVLADPQVRARGTIGGAVAHGDPAADLPAVLLALDAELTVAKTDGSRTVALDDFLLGVFETDLAEDELVTRVAIPAAPCGQAYEKYEHPASHLPLAGVCAVVELADGVITGARIAVTGVAGRAFRAREAEAALGGQEATDEVIDAAAALVRGAAPRPLADIHASGPFRLHLAEVLTRRALRRALARGEGEAA